MVSVNIDQAALTKKLHIWGEQLGFQQIAITNTELGDDEKKLNSWLRRGMHGEMSYLSRHGTKRTRPAELVDGTISVISARMNYLSEPNPSALDALKDRTIGYISRYALGRDYHKLIRRRLKSLAELLAEEIGPFGYRVFTDSAPVMERALARKAGLGWVGKHTNLISREHGSWFFLGEIYTDIPLTPHPESTREYCGSCTACIDVCPTQAIVAPYQVDARRCISYLTIELKGTIPLEFRRQIGNRIFGCDDCQIFCPWNRYAKLSLENGFSAREEIKDIDLIELFCWSEAKFDEMTVGSAIRRINYQQWSRNLAIAIGNAEPHEKYTGALKARLHEADAMLREHIEWAISEQSRKLSSNNNV